MKTYVNCIQVVAKEARVEGNCIMKVGGGNYQCSRKGNYAQYCIQHARLAWEENKHILRGDFVVDDENKERYDKVVTVMKILKSKMDPKGALTLSEEKYDQIRGFENVKEQLKIDLKIDRMINIVSFPYDEESYGTKSYYSSRLPQYVEALMNRHTKEEIGLTESKTAQMTDLLTEIQSKVDEFNKIVEKMNPPKRLRNFIPIHLDVC